MKKTILSLLLVGAIPATAQYVILTDVEDTYYEVFGIMEDTGNINCSTISPLENEIYKGISFTQIKSNCKKEQSDNYGHTQWIDTADIPTTKIGTHVENSCKSIKTFDSNLGDGIYPINIGEELNVYCDMTTEGGGWTLVLGKGSEYNRSHSFWNGVNPNDGVITNYNGNTISTTNSAKLLANLNFTDLMFTESGSSEVFSSNVESTFINKKANKTSFSGLTWNYSAPGGGYTVAQYLLGKTTGSKSYDDYPAKGLGLYGYASTRGTYYGTRHFKASGTITCNNAEYCIRSKGYTSSASLGRSGHRYISGTHIIGLFFR